jgi:hypothetical protein
MRSWVAVLFLLSCHKDKDATDTGGGDADTDADSDADVDADSDADTDSQTAGARLVNASEALGSVDLYVDGDSAAALAGLPALVASPWRQVFPGSRTFTVVAAGGSPSGGSDLSLTVDSQRRYTLVVFGNSDAPQFLGGLEDSSGLDPTKNRFWLFHTATGAGPIDVYDLRQDPPVPLASGIAYGQQAFADSKGGPVELGVDVDQDHTLDLDYQLPLDSSGAVVPLFFTFHGSDLVLLGASPSGGSSVVMPTSLGTDTGLVPSTGDTGLSASTADTGGGGTGDTGVTGGSGASTSDTGP